MILLYSFHPIELIPLWPGGDFGDDYHVLVSVVYLRRSKVPVRVNLKFRLLITEMDNCDGPLWTPRGTLFAPMFFFLFGNPIF